MLKSISLVCLFISISYYSISGNDNYPIGARSAGVANASLAYKDVWSLWQNQAGIATLKEITTGVYYENKFLLPELSLKAFGVAAPIKDLGVFGFSYTGFGYSLYSEKKFGIAYAKSFHDIISFGVQMDYLSTYIGDNYGTRNTVAAEMGFQAKVLPELILAAHIYNPNRAKLSSYNDERIPTILKIGLAYSFSDKVICSIENEKDISQSSNTKVGLEYHAIKQFYIRMGIATNPRVDCFGIGIDIKGIRLDISETIHQQLGYSSGISLSYIFK